MRHSFFGGFALWSVCVTLSGAVIAWGHVALMGHNHAVQHPTGGQVADLWVKEGDIVQLGAPLLRLDGHAQNVQLDLTEGTCSKSWLGAHVWWPNVMIAYPSNLIRF